MRWIPIDELNFTKHKVLMRDANYDDGYKLIGAGFKKEDGTYEWGYSYLGSTPTHYFSF